VITKKASIVSWMASLCAVCFLAPLAAQAQAAPTDPAPAGVAPPPTTVAPEPAPAPAPEPLPPPVVAAPAPEPIAPPPPVMTEEVAPPPAPEDASKKPIAINAWGRVGTRLQGLKDPKKLDHLAMDGDLELHFDGQATNEIGITGNLAAVWPTSSGDTTGAVSMLDLILRFDITDPFHVWVGRMLVPSDRANFSGTWFEAPWYYPGTWIPGAFVGPREGPYGRNDGATIWGQVEGGLFKYYVSAFELDNGGKPLWSGRLNLSVINPEPGYYHSSTYYGGKDLLAIGVGAQFKKDGSALIPPATAAMPMPTATAVDDYALFNADVLFEKNLKDSGVLDLEGAIYKYFGDYETFKFSWLALASWMTPEKVGPGKIQPLVRFQQAKPQSGDASNSLEAQIGYVIADYGARLALGYQYTKTGSVKGNALYLGAQVLK
jgi:hypothetical protein